MVGHQVNQRTVEPKDATVHRLTQRGGAGGNGVKSRLDVGRRATDDVQDLPCSRLLLQRFGEFLRTLLEALFQGAVMRLDLRA